MNADGAPESLRRRLAELGLRPGAQVRVVQRTAGGGRIVDVAGSRVALGRGGARGGHGRGRAHGRGSPVAWQCHERRYFCRPATSPGPSPTAGPGAAVVALAGTPNVGKSSLFNTVTGARRTVGNWPGTTVEVGRGAWDLGGDPARQVTLVDLPGAYSLDAMSPDEEVTRDLVLAQGEGAPSAVVVVTSAAHLARGLYLVAQLRERTLPVVVALTMLDVAERRGLDTDAAVLADELGCPVVALDPRRRRGGGQLAAAVQAALVRGPLEPRHTPPTSESEPAGDELALADERFSWIARAVERAQRHAGGARRTFSDRVDRWATAPVVGPLLFLAVMWAVFQVTTVVAAPLQDALDSFFAGPVADGADRLLAWVGLGESPVRGFVVDGLIAGVGMLLTFVPLMALMFLLLAVLEDSGYMARAAVVTDRLMGRLGLPGRAFLPLVVGFGCNVPAIAATRILPQARHRLLTALLVPFTSCTARLTVYVLLATTFFPEHAGSVVFAMYLLSIVLVVLVGLLLRGVLWRALGAEPLVLDLPPYQRPTARLSLAVTWLRLKGFLRTASGIIVATVVIVWFLQSVPAPGAAGTFGAVPVEDSVYAAIARSIAPDARPGRLRGMADGLCAHRGVHCQGGGHLVLGADLRPGGAELGTRTGGARAAASGDVHGLLGRACRGRGARVHGLPARLHPMCRNAGRAAAGDRSALDRSRGGDAVGGCLRARRGGFPGRPAAVVSAESRPVTAVLAALQGGARSLAEVASGTAEGTSGCGSSAPSTRRSGPVLVALRVSRPPG
jgi:ferrous iron transport protein B